MAAPSNRSMPGATFIPELGYPDVREAAAWLCQTFGFTERLRIVDHRAQLTFGSAAMVVMQRDLPSPGSIMVRVDDADSMFNRIVSLGVPVTNPPVDHMYGERQFSVQDIGGHNWTFSQSMRDVDPADWGGELV